MDEGCTYVVLIFMATDAREVQRSLDAPLWLVQRRLHSWDIARHIITKAVLSITQPDFQDALGCQQMCCGLISRIQAAVHAARQAFDSEECEAALLIDATNAFHSLNRQVALHNIRRLCPPICGL